MTTERCAYEIQHAAFSLRMEERFCPKHGESSFLRNAGNPAAPTIMILHTLSHSSSIKEQEILNLLVILLSVLPQFKFRVRYGIAGLSYAVCLRFL
jgi:ribosomal protein S27AE